MYEQVKDKAGGEHCWQPASTPSYFKLCLSTLISRNMSWLFWTLQRGTNPNGPAVRMFMKDLLMWLLEHADDELTVSGCIFRRVHGEGWTGIHRQWQGWQAVHRGRQSW